MKSLLSALTSADEVISHIDEALYPELHKKAVEFWSEVELAFINYEGNSDEGWVPVDPAELPSRWPLLVRHNEQILPLQIQG
jgi:hypothetical protein